MTKRKPIRNSEELFHRISRINAEAEWTNEELEEELRQEGIDPEKLVKNVKAKVDELLNKTRTSNNSFGQQNDSEANENSHKTSSPLATLRDYTKLRATEIADAMEVTPAFLSSVGRYPKVVPISWQRELDKRAHEKLRTPQGIITGAFQSEYQLPMAALRDTAYESEEMSPEKILAQSGMDTETMNYWLSLLTEE